MMPMTNQPNEPSGLRRVAVPTEDDLLRATAVVSAQLAPTPVIGAELPGGRGVLAMKLETLQPTGSFKVRGALAALSAYAGNGRPVVTASAGNHGLGVAFAAARLAAEATIVLPSTASPAKINELRRLGADLVLHGNGYDEAERHALALAADGAVFVSAYNDLHVIAGQATCAAEIIEQVPGELTLVVPAGGGGLLAGTVLRCGGQPDVRVIGVEAEASRALSAAVAAGRVVPVPVEPTLADGLAGNLEPASITPMIAAGRVDRFVAVTEDEIAAAIRFLATWCGLVVEGSGATGVAALLAGKVPVAGRPVTILTGRNIAADVLADLLSRSC
jgi:threonine dehydratase